MRWLRGVELTTGLLVGALGLAGIAAGWLMPFSVASERVYRNGRLIGTHSYSTSLAQLIGVRPAIALLAGFGALAIWVALAAVLHIRSRNSQGLGMEWLAAAVLVLASLASVLLLGYIFWPSALLALVCVLVATTRQVRLQRMP